VQTKRSDTASGWHGFDADHRDETEDCQGGDGAVAGRPAQFGFQHAALSGADAIHDHVHLRGLVARHHLRLRGRSSRDQVRRTLRMKLAGDEGTSRQRGCRLFDRPVAARGG
jgi:hypothetical protein